MSKNEDKSPYQKYAEKINDDPELSALFEQMCDESYAPEVFAAATGLFFDALALLSQVAGDRRGFGPEVGVNLSITTTSLATLVEMIVDHQARSLRK